MNSKCGVQSKRRCESHEPCVCIAGFSACACQKKSVVYETECRHVAVQRGKQDKNHLEHRHPQESTKVDVHSTFHSKLIATCFQHFYPFTESENIILIVFCFFAASFDTNRTAPPLIVITDTTVVLVFLLPTII